MKISDLLKPWKPKKPKKRPDPWFFVWGWGGGTTETGGGDVPVSEDTGEKKVYSKDGLPEKIYIDKGFFLVRIPNNSVVSYAIRQLMNPQRLGAVYLHESGNTWAFSPSTSIFKDNNRQDFLVTVSPSQLYNPLKLKWWVTNRLIGLKLLPSKVNEGKDELISLSKGIEKLPKRIPIGSNGYYVELVSDRKQKATYVVKRMLSQGEVYPMSMVLSKMPSITSDYHYIIEVIGKAVDGLPVKKRKLISINNDPDIFDVNTIRDFMKQVIQASSLPKD